MTRDLLIRDMVGRDVDQYYRHGPARIGEMSFAALAGLVELERFPGSISNCARAKYWVLQALWGRAAPT